VSTKAMMGAVVALTAILASPAFAGPADSTRNSHNSPRRLWCLCSADSTLCAP